MWVWVLLAKKRQGGVPLTKNVDRFPNSRKQKEQLKKLPLKVTDILTISQNLSDPEKLIQLSTSSNCHSKSCVACSGEGQDVRNLPYVCLGKICYTDLCLIRMISKFIERFSILENSSTHERQKIWRGTTGVFPSEINGLSLNQKMLT